MSRARAKLSEKEERILIQAQLMGLDTASMVRIGNRLRALDKEREVRASLDQLVQGITWEKLPNVKHRESWKVINEDGKHFVFTAVQNAEREWNGCHFYWEITVNKPGTRFEERVIKKQRCSVAGDIPKKMLPEKSTALYSAIRHIKNTNWSNL
jgi:hypothetical protein